MRIPLATDLKVRTGNPDKDARLKNSYVETRGDQSAVRKRPIAQGGIEVGTGQGQGGIGFKIDDTETLVVVYDDTVIVVTDDDATTWDVATDYFVGDHVTINFVDYWALTDNIGQDPTTNPDDWSDDFVPEVPSPWNLMTVPTGLFDVVSNGSIFCAIGGANSATSSDGINWTTHSVGVGYSFPRLAWGDTKFCTVGIFSVTGLDYSAVSPDGSSWIITALPTPTSSNSLARIAWNGTIFVAADAAGVLNVFTSPDGVNWTDTGTAIAAAKIVAGNGRFVAVDNGSPYISYSDDGITWIAATGGPSGAVRIVAWNGAKFCALSQAGDAYTSTNGATWTVHSFPIIASQIVWDGTQFIALSNNAYTTSADGETWVASRLLPVTATWAGIASLNGTTIAFNSTTTGIYLI